MRRVQFDSTLQGLKCFMFTLIFLLLNSEFVPHGGVVYISLNSSLELQNILSIGSKLASGRQDIAEITVDEPLKPSSVPECAGDGAVSSMSRQEGKGCCPGIDNG